MPQPIPIVSLENIGAWLTIAGFGAYHGLNPAMGWLFALALGLQQNSSRAVWQAMLPITAGHAASVAITAGVIVALNAVIPLTTLRIMTAVLLLGFGTYKLINWYRHPRWVGMRVTWYELIGWSFLMATAHGAGLMIAPAFLGVMSMNGSHASHLTTGLDVGAAIALHSFSMLAVMALVAWIVYFKVGLMVLRKSWINFDLIWSAALLVVGGVALIVAI